MIAQDFRKIALACDTVSTLPGDVAVTFRGGNIFARNVSLVACQPIDRDLNFVTSSYDLRDLLRRMEDPTFKVNKDHIRAQGKNSWAKLPLLDVEVDYAAPTMEPRDCPEGFIEAILASGNFTGEDKSRLFMRSVRVMGDRTFATNGQCAYSHKIEPVGDFSIPGPLIEFLRRRKGEVKSWGVSDREIAFWFQDGGWVRGARLNTEIPDRFVKVLDDFYPDEELPEFPDKWKERFRGWYDMAEDVIEVYPTHLFGRRNRTEHVLEVATPLSVERAAFDAKLLASVVEVADCVDFTKFPNPVPFCSTNGRGIFVGRTET